MYVVYAHMYAGVHSSVHYLILLRQGLSLNLKLGWKPASPINPPVSMSSQLWGYRYVHTYACLSLDLYNCVVVNTALTHTHAHTHKVSVNFFKEYNL